MRIEKVSAPVRLQSALECLRFEQESFGALHQMLAGLSPSEQDDAWAEIETALGQFEHDGQFEGPCENARRRCDQIVGSASGLSKTGCA
ncbi:hypothetical protein [Mesorhizobium sp. Root695]|uniref:hypothetical protein n=1 Tax=Mesorhizobium sp. Root695 TaxID=1736589 RepID=UPI001910C05B|nr:hypothetical protein [Mesorhizobium sp. Root695]